MSIFASSSHVPAGAAASPGPLLSCEQTTVCVVGSGPAGAVLTLLLARQGLPVVLLEAHTDFERAFRGDVLHPSVLQIMDELGLAERLLRLPHTKLPAMHAHLEDGSHLSLDFRRLHTPYPYLTLVPQEQFLSLLTHEALRYQHVRLLMGARVEQLIREDGRVQGVRYRGADGWHEVRAMLTVGADGRFSRVRQLAGMRLIATSPPMDVLWFRLPRSAADGADSFARFRHGQMLVLVNRLDHWQLGYVIPKGQYQHLKRAGLEALRQRVAELVPEVASRVVTLEAWNQIAVLSVESSRLAQWYQPGLLLIGDAAHPMSPVSGVGINYAIQDAVETANVLSRALKAGRVSSRELARVQRRRVWPTRCIQAYQRLVQQRIVVRALDASKPLTVPAVLRLPLLQRLLARLIGLGIWPVHVQTEAASRVTRTGERPSQQSERP